MIKIFHVIRYAQAALYSSQVRGLRASAIKSHRTLAVSNPDPHSSDDKSNAVQIKLLRSAEQFISFYYKVTFCSCSFCKNTTKFNWNY